MEPSRLDAVVQSLLIVVCVISGSMQYSSLQSTAPNAILLAQCASSRCCRWRLGPSTNVLVRGNRIANIGPSATTVSGATTIDGHGETLHASA